MLNDDFEVIEFDFPHRPTFEVGEYAQVMDIGVFLVTAVLHDHFYQVQMTVEDGEHLYPEFHADEMKKVAQP